MNEYEKVQQLQQRFWEHLFGSRLHLKGVQRGLEIEVFFETLETTFGCGPYNDSMVPVYCEVVQYIAAYAHRWAEGNPEVSHHGENSTGLPYHLNRAYEGFFETITDAIKKDRIHLVRGDWRFRTLVLPRWLVDHFEKERLHFRKLRKEHGIPEFATVL
jgi:hypothetical protein